MAQLCLEFVVSKQKERDNSNPYLGQDGILAGPQKALYFEMLLDPLEEQFHLPSLSVDIGNGAS